MTYTSRFDQAWWNALPARDRLAAEALAYEANRRLPQAPVLPRPMPPAAVNWPQVQRGRKGYRLDTPAGGPSTVEDVARSVPAGLGSGLAGVLGTPVSAAEVVADWLSDWVAYRLDAVGVPVPDPETRRARREERESQALIPMPNIRTFQGLANMIPGVDYTPQTMPGEFAKTVSEFVPGAIVAGPLGSAPKNVLRYGVLPGVASETAGQATEGMEVSGVDVEPWARTVGGLLGAVMGSRLMPDPSSIPGVHPSAARRTARVAARDLESRGRVSRPVSDIYDDRRARDLGENMEMLAEGITSRRGRLNNPIFDDALERQALSGVRNEFIPETLGLPAAARTPRSASPRERLRMALQGNNTGQPRTAPNALAEQGWDTDRLANMLSDDQAARLLREIEIDRAYAQADHRIFDAARTSDRRAVRNEIPTPRMNETVRRWAPGAAMDTMGPGVRAVVEFLADRMSAARANNIIDDMARISTSRSGDPLHQALLNAARNHAVNDAALRRSVLLALINSSRAGLQAKEQGNGGG